MTKKLDEKILLKFNSTSPKPWGLYTSIDLQNCNIQTIRNPQKIKEFTRKLCDLLKVKRYGETIVVDFGKNPRVTGYSMVQLIETSLVSAHFGNAHNGAFVYLDIFSCQKYPPYKAAQFTKKFFKGQKMKVKVNFRY